MMEMKITVEAPDLAASILKLAEAIASGPDPALLIPDEPLPVSRLSGHTCGGSCGPRGGSCEPCTGKPYPGTCAHYGGPCGGPQPLSHACDQCADCWPDICRPW